jgi:hypothetical protein
MIVDGLLAFQSNPSPSQEQVNKTTILEGDTPGNAISYEKSLELEAATVLESILHTAFVNPPNPRRRSYSDSAEVEGDGVEEEEFKPRKTTVVKRKQHHSKLPISEGGSVIPGSMDSPFFQHLVSVIEKTGRSIKRIPKVGGSLLNFEQLLNIVMTNGGVQRCTDRKLWRAIAGRIHPLHFNFSPKGSDVLFQFCFASNFSTNENPIIVYKCWVSTS